MTTKNRVLDGFTKGWNESTSQTHHGQLMSYVKRMTEDEARYVRADAMEAALAMPDGHKAGYYTDLVLYCGMKLNGNL